MDRPRIRILHVVTSLDVGGAETMLEKLVSDTTPGRFETMVVSLMSGGRIAQRMVDAGIEVRSLAVRRGRVDPIAIMRLFGVLRRYRPDILQTWLYHADLLGTFASRLGPAVNLVWNIRCADLDFSQYSPLTKWTVRALARLSGAPHAVIVNSEAGRRSHAELGYKPRRWEVIPNGFDTARFEPSPTYRRSFRAALGIEDDAFVVGLPARFDPMKDHASFLAAARLFLDAGLTARFVLIGRGTEPTNRTIGASIARLGLGGFVCALGEQEQMERVLPGLDVAVLSSGPGEGFPNVLGEAMACGVPCITTDVGDAAMIVGDTGLTVPPNDPTALAGAMIEMARMSGSDRIARGERARARVEQNFSLRQVVARYEALYEALVGCGSESRPSQAPDAAAVATWSRPRDHNSSS